MGSEFLLPGTVVAFKFLLRLFLNQEVDKVKFQQALLQFPIDLAFLAFSFATASLITAAAIAKTKVEGEASLSLILIFLLVTTVVIVFCSFANKAFVRDENRLPYLFLIPSYFLSIIVLFISFRAGALL